LFAQLVSKIFNLCGHDPPTSQTDRQTDRQTTCDSKNALCAIVHCAVKMMLNLLYLVNQIGLVVFRTPNWHGI